MLPKSLDTLRIDINSGKVRKSVAICQQDTIQRTLNFQLVDSGTAIDMSNLLFAEILIHKADGYEADNGCVIDGDSVQYTLRTTDTSALGINQAQLQLTFADGQVVTTPTFEIVVYSKVLDQNVQRSTNEYTALTEQLVLVNEMKTQAEGYVTEAQTAATNATEQAEIAEGHATDAETSATNAATSATDAGTSASAAATSATNAMNSAAAAATSATNAASSSTAAGNYADNASDSATNAANSATAAANSASAAATSSESAAGFANNANLSATAAANSATDAETSATNAATSEDNALDYAERAEAAYEAMGEEQLVLGETSSTAYRGDRGKTAYDHSQTTGNPHATTYSDVGADQAGAAAAAYQQAAGYTDLKIAELINGAPQTLDTLKEIADAMAEHEEVVEALQDAIGSKAAEADFQGHAENTTIHITAAERTLWNGISNIASEVLIEESEF